MIAGSSQVVWPVVLYQYGLPKVGSVAIVHSMVIVGVSIDLTTHADVLTVSEMLSLLTVSYACCTLHTLSTPFRWLW